MFEADPKRHQQRCSHVCSKIQEAQSGKCRYSCSSASLVLEQYIMRTCPVLHNEDIISENVIVALELLLPK